MGIQPIDLQIMYSQAANAAKAATGAQASAQLSQSMHQSTVVQQNLENSQKVHALSNEQSKSSAVSDKGGGNGSGAYGSSKKKEKILEDKICSFEISLFQMQIMSHTFLFRAKVTLIELVWFYFYRHNLHYFKAIAFKANTLDRVVGHKAHFGNPKFMQD